MSDPPTYRKRLDEREINIIQQWSQMSTEKLTRNKNSIYPTLKKKEQMSPQSRTNATSNLEMLHTASKENIKVTAIYKKMEQRKSTIPVKESTINLARTINDHRLSRDFPPMRIKENELCRDPSKTTRYAQL